MNRYTFFARALSGASAVIALSLCLAGCGGSDDDDPNFGLPIAPSASPSASAYAGGYSSRVALPEGKTGSTNIVVAANGTATGTLTVTDATRSRQATAFSFGAGTYAISGTVDPTTGVFTMTGNIGGESFSYSGTLPAPGNGGVGGSYTLTAGGQTYTGSFANTVVTPTPTPSPSVSPSVAPPSDSALSVTFRDIDGVTNVDTSAFTTENNTLLQAYPYGAGTIFQSLTVIVNSTVVDSTDPARSRRFIVQFFDLAPPVGTVFQIGQAGAGVQFYQFEENTGLSPKGRLYNGAGGTVTVLARTGSSITVRLSGVTMTPGAYISGLPTTGVFVADGEITAPIQ